VKEEDDYTNNPKVVVQTLFSFVIMYHSSQASIFFSKFSAFYSLFQQNKKNSCNLPFSNTSN